MRTNKTAGVGTTMYCENCVQRKATKRINGRHLCDACHDEIDRFMVEEQARIVVENLRAIH